MRPRPANCVPSVCVTCWKSNGAEILLRSSSPRGDALLMAETFDPRVGLAKPIVDEDPADDRLILLPVLINIIPPLANSVLVAPSDRSQGEYTEPSRKHRGESGLDRASSDPDPVLDRLLCHSGEVMVLPLDGVLGPSTSSLFSLLCTLTRSANACRDGSAVCREKKS